MRSCRNRCFVNFIINCLINLIWDNNIVTNTELFNSFGLFGFFFLSFDNLSSNTELKLSGIIIPWSFEFQKDNNRISQCDHKKTDINDIIESNNMSELRNINPSNKVGNRKSLPIDSINLWSSRMTIKTLQTSRSCN